MTDQPKREMPCEKGDRVYLVSEKQIFCLMQGWTHTSLFDPKNILYTIAEDNPIYKAPLIGQQPPPSSEPKWITVYDGSDRVWKPISVYELQELEYAINEECVGKTDRCPPGHLKEMHDSGNDIIDKARLRPTITYPESTK